MLLASCNLRRANLHRDLFQIESSIAESHILVTISAHENLYYERNCGNSFFSLYQGGVSYQSNSPELYIDSIVSTPRPIKNSDVILGYLAKGEQDTLYNVNLCGLETYGQFDKSREFNIQISQFLYLAQNSIGIGKKIWHKEMSPTMLLSCE